jgi:nucleotidyltransferase substrate binding protein (TIGR01987 family)
MKLDITPLKNAIERLREGLARHYDAPADTQLRDGLIQRFEFTYEQCHKILKRYLELAAATPEEFENSEFSFLIRSGNEQGLLQGDWPKWRLYREMRGKTSHTYDEGVALEVVAGIPGFLEEALYLRDQLQRRLG